MFKNYLIVAWRNLVRNPVYSSINIIGLSIGIATGLLILLWVQDELSFDSFHSNVDHLYAVEMNGNVGNEIRTWSSVPALVYDELKNQPTLFRRVAITNEGRDPCLLSVGENRLNRTGRFVSESFLEMFRFPLIHGDPTVALDDRNSIVLTASLAKSLFGDADPINQQVTINNNYVVRVTGILQDLPVNSTLQFDYLLTFSLFESIKPWIRECRYDPDCQAFKNFVELEDNVSADDINREIKDIIKKHTAWLNPEIFLYPMSRWHLHGEFENGKENSNDREDYVFYFTLIAIGVLSIASVNYMNLSTARSERRAREVGIRKIAGSQRSQLIIQFLRESVLTVAIAFAVALTFVQLLLPIFNTLVNKSLSIRYGHPYIWAFSISLVLVLGMISGSYPAFYLSSFKPVEVLKGTMKRGAKSVRPREVLVVSQFAFSIFLLIGSVVIYQQFHYASQRDLGYIQGNAITIPNNDGLKKTYPAIKNALLATNVVASSTKSNSPITEVYESNFMFPNGGSDLENKIDIVNIYAEYDYLKTMGIQLIAGRDFSKDIMSDSSAVILNQSAAALLGLKNPMGTKVNIAGAESELIGITEDVLMDSPYLPIEPMYIVLETKWAQQTTPQNITVRFNEGVDLQAAVQTTENVFKKLNPLYPFEYSFVDEDFNRKFQIITTTARLMTVFSVMAILIACLGLFGLASFTAERRTREFGIRKILGAGVLDLVELMSWNFIRLVFLSLVIATPIAWWILSHYLERYPYHISLDWTIFPIIGGLILLLTLLVVATQAVKVAMGNPVKNLTADY